MACSSIAVVRLAVSPAQAQELLGNDAALEAIRKFLSQELKHAITLDTTYRGSGAVYWESAVRTVLTLNANGFSGYDITSLETTLQEFVGQLGLAVRKQQAMTSLRKRYAVVEEGTSPADPRVYQMVISI